MSINEKKLAALPDSVLRTLNRGIEKESLRVMPDGRLSEKPHPPALGSAMTHPLITTDFSEAQLELVTQVHPSIDACLSQLEQIHQVVYHQIDDELLWPTSMPCRLPADDEIPIGQYGSSNIGRSKTVYRLGLAHRYGRRMQTISGVHYNFSLPESAWPLLQTSENDQRSAREYQSASYLAMIRNFKRHSWLLLYLFGASPAVCGSFVAGRSHRLEPLGNGSMYLPYGTSVRMGPLGYQSEAQKSLAVSFNDLAGYEDTLSRGLTEPYPPYVDIGIRDGDEYRQLNDTLLQIENEFYGAIRPKRRINPGERPLRALNERGIEYLEVRCLDLDPFSPIGVASTTAHFVELFLMHCLLTDSPPDSPESLAIDGANQLTVAERGRTPGLSLTQAQGGSIGLSDWAAQMLSQCEPIAQALDHANGSDKYSLSLQAANAVVADVQQSPSAKVLNAMSRDWGNSYQQFAQNQANIHRETALTPPPEPAMIDQFDTMATESIARQREIEQADTEDFETYRRNYVAQDLTVNR